MIYRSLRFLTICCFFGALVLFAASTTPLAWSAPPDPALVQAVSQRIEERITIRDNGDGFVCRGEPICGIELLPEFYASRGYAPVWLDAGGLRPTAEALIRTLGQVYEDGLNPADYHLATIQTMVEEVDADLLLGSGDRASHWAELDFLLTDAFLLLSSHLSGGRVNPETLHSDWMLFDQSVDIMALLQEAVTEAQLDQALEKLRPSYEGYTRLRAALKELRHLDSQGGWPQVSAGETLAPGDRGARVLTLRHRLQVSGDLPPGLSVESPDLLDDNLVAAVRRFQTRHGLEADGLVGPHTLAELNVPVGVRLRQVELNLERWRWLPHQLGDRYIAVNTADFSLEVVEANQPVLRMRVVVGRPARRTPVFSASMTYLELNPFWTIPLTIAVEDVLPQAVANPGYFESHGIKVYHGWEDDAPPLDPRTVDWSRYGANDFPFRFVQAPGPTNALGRMKFMFPNKFAIYLHDTPNRYHFDLTKRDFSSGCIRVENSVALAEYLLKERPGWSREALEAALKTGERQVLHIPRPIPVHLLYLTAWVDRSGVLQFRKDIYDRDVELDRALRKRMRAPRSIPAVGLP